MTMRTTMLGVDTMVVTAVGMMSTHNTAQLANVLTLQSNALVHVVVLNGKVMNKNNLKLRQK